MSAENVIRQLIAAGFTPATVIAAVEAGDLSRLEHSSLYPVELQEAHKYLSTSCWHKDHDRCSADTAVDILGEPFAKEPAICKLCRAPCICWCHQLQA